MMPRICVPNGPDMKWCLPFLEIIDEHSDSDGNVFFSVYV